MASTRTTEETYEAQNDERLEALHSKVRTLREVSARHTQPSSS